MPNASSTGPSTANGTPGDGDLRRQILDTTRHLLVRDGFSNLSMRKIARSIGYSATSIYLHFESKDALLHTLIDEGMQHLYDRLEAAAAAHPHQPLNRLEALCRTFIDFGLSNPEYYEIMFQLHPEHMERYPAEKYRRARRNLDIIAETLGGGAACGDLSVDNPRVSASTVWASLHGTVSLLLAQRVDVRIDRTDFIESAIQQTLRSYAALPRSA
ncbi:TetR/AcrR family transcriptional regulator [Salisaeta longa]|uniref:TetR/AcrR family transcriptional regulator n=1 Tax=Salisaeta longa TaxID=503170 RepID=UPI0003B37D4A|nr:TetR/AcrR family transcriptional regulator [Salisaeta longa]